MKTCITAHDSRCSRPTGVGLAAPDGGGTQRPIMGSISAPPAVVECCRPRHVQILENVSSLGCSAKSGPRKVYGVHSRMHAKGSVCTKQRGVRRIYEVLFITINLCHEGQLTWRCTGYQGNQDIPFRRSTARLQQSLRLQWRDPWTVVISSTSTTMVRTRGEPAVGLPSVHCRTATPTQCICGSEFPCVQCLLCSPGERR